MNVLRDERVKARKAGRCIWCGEAIQKGEVHHIQAGKVDGEFQANRYHSECYEAALEDFREGDCDFEEASHKRGSRECA
jgi:hypothetical protein